MASNGIEGATYKRGNKYVRYSIEGTVRRDVLTAVHQLSNNITIEACNEMNVDYVEVSQHYGARTNPTNPIANHYGWQGKVYKITGSEKGYPNLTEATGYPDDILGLGGVNCRHRMFPFWKGISIPNPIKYDEKENARIYEATQHQRKLERDIRKLKKKKACADAMGDKETSDLMQIKLNQKYQKIDSWCKQNGLKRDYSRELVSEQVKTNPTIANSAESDIINSGGKAPNWYEPVEFNSNAEFRIDLNNYPEFINTAISKEYYNVAKLGSIDGNEHLALVNLETGITEYFENGLNDQVGGTAFWDFVKENKNNKYAFVHNHNTASKFSEADMRTLLGDNPVDMFVISRLDGKCYIVERNSKKPINVFFDSLYESEIRELAIRVKNGEITAGERTYLRESILVNNLIRDFTKGLKEFG